MEIDLTTPALLFSAISLIMLAYTNRFMSYAQLVRTLKEQYRENHSSVTAAQIANLRKTSVSDACYAGDRDRQLIVVCRKYVLYLYTTLSCIHLYLWTGNGVADYLSGYLCVRDLYFGEGFRDTSG